MFRISFILFMLLPVYVFPQSPDLALKSLQEKFKSINDLSADFTRSSGSAGEFSGKLFYKKDNKVRLELKNSTIISNGEISWNYSRSRNQVVISEFDEKDPSALSLQKILYDYPAECSLTSKKVSGKEILVLVPENSSELNFSKIEITLNKENLPGRISIDDPDSGIFEVTLSNYKLNQNIPDNKFTFSPPEGSRVIDLRAE